MKRLQMLKIARIIPIIALLTATAAFANVPAGFKPGVKDNKGAVLTSRADCNQGSSRFDMDINNVRATLLSSGDVWWDLQNAAYVIPKVEAGSGAKSVSSIFAGAVWLGGKDVSGGLKVACQTYRSAAKNDFWPGPLKDNVGSTDPETCSKWDIHFEVTAKDIDSAKRVYRNAVAKNPTDPQVDCASIPENVKGWPAKGNPYFAEIHRFNLPKTNAGLAKFFDRGNDLSYDPCDGDYPIIDVKGCETVPVVPDQMVFWIYNDAGGVHTQSANSTPIQMEVQVQAFAYKTNDELNDMTFQRYKLINRARTDINDMYFAMWVDFDLGCSTDDYMGCDTTRNLAYCYNQDALDGTTGCVCSDAGVNTYCDKIPIIGIDYFRGPNDENGKEIGLSSFTYYFNTFTCNPLAGTTDPGVAQEYYNYLTGKWKDGTPFTSTGSGYNPGNTKTTKFAYPDQPNNGAGWSMVSANQQCGDRREIQASGPFKLKPGAINELIVGVPWVANQVYPAPDIRRMLEADDIAQALFDNCFRVFDGPDAPDMCIVEQDRELILLLSNKPDKDASNNAFEDYRERGLKISAKTADSFYLFQGYKIYQLQNANVSPSDFDDPSQSRLVAQVDIRDSIGAIYNWTPTEDPFSPGRFIYVANKKIDGKANKGVTHSFTVKEDKFATTEDKKLINHKKYYFAAIAFAYNNYERFDPAVAKGQKEPYVVGRKNIGDPTKGTKGANAYVAIPRPAALANINSKYGDGTPITRLDGIGNGGNFIDMSEETLKQIIDGTFDGTIKYKGGRGPIDVKIVNPTEVVDGQYQLTFKDKNMTDLILEKDATWELRQTGSTNVIASEKTIEKLNEQIVVKYGFSIAIQQAQDAGTNPIQDKTNGAIGSEIAYDGGGTPWLTAVLNKDLRFRSPVPALNYMKTGDPTEVDFNLDPQQALTKMSEYFVPYYLCEYDPPAGFPVISPAWQVRGSGGTVRGGARGTNSSVNGLFNLNNVNIVYTKDKSKWSRCVVIETASTFYVNDANGPKYSTVGNAKMFEFRASPSVGKDADPNDPNKAVGQVLPSEQAQGITKGMGWFPGYAVDVESGKRLNIFFGENSSFDPEIGNYDPASKGINKDMIWNPSSQAFLTTQRPSDLGTFLFFGGQQYVYVTKTPYDSCNDLRQILLTNSNLTKPRALREITWTSMPFLLPNTKLLSYKDGLIPSDVTVKLRVNNPYSPNTGKNTNKTYPSYQFELKGKQSTELVGTQVDSSLNLMKVVPNPYYGFSGYEADEYSTTVKITNLPAKATVTVYTLDGKFIRQFKRDEKKGVVNPLGLPKGEKCTNFMQITPDLEWDMKNSKGIPIASGVYLIHVDSEQGQRTLKFFAVNRQFDASRL